MMVSGESWCWRTFHDDRLLSPRGDDGKSTSEKKSVVRSTKLARS